MSESVNVLPAIYNYVLYHSVEPNWDPAPSRVYFKLKIDPKCFQLGTEVGFAFITKESALLEGEPVPVVLGIADRPRRVIPDFVCKLDLR